MRWVVVSGGFHRRSGMGRANFELARHLLLRGDHVEIVTYEIDRDLSEFGRLEVHKAGWPLGSHLLAEFHLGREGQRVASRAISEDRSTRVITCGGNCAWPGVNWVHGLHHAWDVAHSDSPVWFRAKNRVTKWLSRVREKKAIRMAPVVIANSNRTRADIIRFLKIDPSKVHTVYLGSDPGWKPIAADERSRIRQEFSINNGQRVALFAGALGYDANKGFDTLLAAWAELRRSRGWNTILLAAGAGRGIENWQKRIQQLDLAGLVRLVGFQDPIERFLAAGDVFVGPSRYESYGLSVHEAVLCGLPVISSANAGVAERYPPELSAFLLKEPGNHLELSDKLWAWSENSSTSRASFEKFRVELLRHTWDDMAHEICDLALNY